jgi:hypothetical protein
MKKAYSLVFVLAILISCNKASGNTTPATVPASITRPAVLPTLPATAVVMPTETLIPSSTPDTRISPERWQEWPVVPIIRPEMEAVYQRGKDLGNNPGAFSKIGDGEISTVWFLTQYDLGPDNYHLGAYADLETVIQIFTGSFSHIGLAAGRGFNTTIILGPVPDGTAECHPGEVRLDCELRTYHPSFAFVSLGTNQVWEPEIFEAGLQMIIESLLKAGVVPILSTKADNLEGDHGINRIIAGLAYEYNLPLWNFWLAVQTLPAHGLQADREHLTYAYSDFDNPTNFQYAWPWRNLTALQSLNTVVRSVTVQP